MPFGKVFAALARKRLRASLRSRGETGRGVRGGGAWECGGEVVVRCCVPVHWGVWWSVVCWLIAGGFARRRGACVDATRCAVAMPVRCPGRFVPSWRARCGVWGLRCSPRYCAWWRVEKVAPSPCRLSQREVGLSGCPWPSDSGQSVLLRRIYTAKAPSHQHRGHRAPLLLTVAAERKSICRRRR